MSGTSPKTDPAQRAMIVSVAVAGVLLAVGAIPLVGLYTAGGVFAGAALAVSNLWAIGLLVRRLLSEDAPAVPWALFAVAKLGILFGTVYLLVFSGLVDILAVVVGYGALPIGIVVAQLGGKRPADEQG